MNMMMSGKEHSFGEVILSKVQYTDTFETKIRPSLILFEEYGNVVCAAITSNPGMKGISLSKKEGATQDSVIKLNYIFTIAKEMIIKRLFKISLEKKEQIKKELMAKIV